MCGILGSINLSFDNRELQLIKHRGPDDEGMETLSVGPHRIILAHKRLSIQDLSQRGHQPMTDASASKRIIFNGEIYNHRELRKGISAAFRGTSDTETIVNLLAEQGVASVNSLNGIFAFAYLDITARKMFLVRDPFGVKPLYYCFKDNGLVFSSELKPIIQVSNEKEINSDALACLLRLRYTPSPLTLLNNVNKVNPGEVIEIDLSKDVLTLEKKSFLETYIQNDKISFKEAIEGYEHKLETAIRSQLLSDVDVGLMLSGGIDSAMVAHYAQKYSQTKLKAFTIGFEGNQNENEIEEANETARFIGLEHYSKKINFENFQNTLNKIIGIVEEPIATGSVIPMYFLSELVSDHVSVVLTGQGADEPLAGYTKYRGELLYNKIPKVLHKGLGNLEGFANTQQLRRGFKIFKEKNPYERFIVSSQVYTSQDINALTGLTNFDVPYQLLTSMANHVIPQNCDNVHKMMFLDLHMNLADDLLMYTDKITMNFSLEARVPMLDLELVKYINSLPLNYKLSLSNSKLIHKKLAKKILPKEIINRPKKGFMTPIDAWFKNENDHFREVLLEKNTNFSNHFDLNEVQKLLKNYSDPSSGYDKRHIFLLISIATWLNNFFELK
ncbi:asparagine synthase (glutamine-hydrolyzing) [Flagellimonas sp. 2504JD4-2]